ncbi:hypothetical protein B0H63DRAFT_530509 [Podospora didyma]|uniref:Uncharacterized protein n=1 Tax=Podospora didyma TaxID=330526 RepID=A0AAE0P3T8_9PEZI|nr:hypothetical protein B0H63DRAFT_530509 [Podospora didyma]
MAKGLGARGVDDQALSSWNKVQIHMARGLWDWDCGFRNKVGQYGRLVACTTCRALGRFITNIFEATPSLLQVNRTHRLSPRKSNLGIVEFESAESKIFNGPFRFRVLVASSCLIALSIPPSADCPHLPSSTHNQNHDHKFNSSCLTPPLALLRESSILDKGDTTSRRSSAIGVVEHCAPSLLQVPGSTTNQIALPKTAWRLRYRRHHDLAAVTWPARGAQLSGLGLFVPSPQIRRSALVGFLTRPAFGYWKLDFCPDSQSSFIGRLEPSRPN